jgi:biopolymer transport protein ExbB/TolQ
MAVAVIIDRVRIFRRARTDTYLLREDVTNCLEEGRLDDAIRRCREHDGPVAAVLLAGLNKYRRLKEHGRSRTEIESITTKTMEDYAPRALDTLETRLNLLVLVGSISPLLGMTGTVTGMIKAFTQMSTAGVDASGVASGISEALVTTAAGLLIAMPAVAAYNILAKRVDRIALEIEETMMEFLDFVSLGGGEN